MVLHKKEIVDKIAERTGLKKKVKVVHMIGTI